MRVMLDSAGSIAVNLHIEYQFMNQIGLVYRVIRFINVGTMAAPFPTFPDDVVRASE